MKQDINKRLDKILVEARGIADLIGDVDPKYSQEEDLLEPETEGEVGQEISLAGTTAEAPPPPKTPSVRNVATGDISTAAGPEPEDVDLSEPSEQQPALAPDELSADKAAQAPPRLNSDQAEKDFHIAIGQIEAVFGSEQDRTNWEKIGNKIGINDPRIKDIYPNIAKEWSAIGDFFRNEIRPLINDIGRRTSNVLRGGMASPESPAPAPEPAPAAQPAQAAQVPETPAVPELELEEITREDLPIL